ncbi:MAG: hypothetical protein AB7Y46_00580 [Armatimonadota bacterium]
MRGSCSASAIVAVLLFAPWVTGHAADLRPEIADHTPPAYADDAELPEALRGMYLPRGALDRLTEVFSSDRDPVRSVHISWLSGDRYLWRIELAQPLSDEQALTAYIDTDGEEATARSDARGAEIMVQIAPGSQRVYEWMADGTLAASRTLRAAIDGAVVWFSYDHPLGGGEGARQCRLWLSVPGGGTDPITVAVPGDGPRPVPAEALELRVREGAVEGTPRSVTVEVTNRGGTDRWIDLQLPLTLPFAGEFSWFDSFNFTPHRIGIAPIGYHGTSAVLPLTCAWDGERGVALALHPMDLYTELHSGVRPVAGGRQMTIGTRLAIMPGETEAFTVLALEFDGRLGWRGAFERYWALFPQVYDRARDIDPRFHMASAGGLYRSWTDPSDERFASDLIRRMRGHWEWGYAPAPRPGEWAVTELSVGEWTRSHGEVRKSLRAEELEETRARIRRWVHDDAQRAGVAVAYYMHLKNVEKGLMEQYWPDSYFQNRPIEYLGYYQFVPCWFAYPWADSYGEYLRQAIPVIARSFEPAGMAFDSVFGFIPHWGPSADRSPATTFDNGLAFVGEGIGFAKQMDVVREQHTGGLRTAMVSNLHLPALSANAVRTDCALLEFHPMSDPNHRERVLRLRMLSGRTMFNWWHTYDPALFSWIPWKELNVQQTIDAFRRLRDDLLIHSLYYGGVPNARFAVGVPKLVRAIPMLIEVSDLGWQPVTGARPETSGLLVSRFGEGVGMALGVGNQGYEPVRDAVIVDRAHVAGGDDLLFMGWEGERTVTECGEQLRLMADVPARDVRAYRAIMSLEAGAVESATATGELHDYQPSEVSIVLRSRHAQTVRAALWQPEPGVMVYARHGRQTHIFIPYAGLTMHPFELELEAGRVEITLYWEPRVALQGDRRALLGFPFVANARPNCNVVTYGDSVGLRDQAFRVQEYFREYFRWAVDEPQDVRLPIVTPEQAPAGRRVLIGLLADLPADLAVDLGRASAGFGRKGDVVYATARTPEMLARAVEGLLFTLDARYEYWGPFFPTQNFFDGDPAKCPAALREAGMAGRTLTGDDTGSLRDVIDLPDLIEW